MADYDAYCGIGKVPKGYRRGSVKDCYEKKQLRYYGLIKYDPEYIRDLQIEEGDLLQKEQIKLHKIHGDIIKLTKRDWPRNQRNLKRDDLTKAKRKQYEKEKEKLLKRRDNLKKRFLAQDKRVKALELEIEGGYYYN
jgi:hypothetical protein